MRVQITGAGAQSITVENKTVGSFLFSIQSTAALTLACLVNSTVSVRTKRSSKLGGAVITNLDGNLYALSKFNDPTKSSLPIDYDGSGSAFGYGFYVTLPTPINLGEGDKLDISFSIQQVVAGQVSTLSVIEAVGVGAYEPIISVTQIDKSNTARQYPLGNMVSAIVVATDGVQNLVTGINLMSDKFSRIMIESDIFGQIASQYDVTPPSNSYDVFQPIDDYGLLDSVIITPSVNQAATTNAWVIVAGGQTSPLVAARAMAKAEKHVIINTQNLLA